MFSSHQGYDDVEGGGSIVQLLEVAALRGVEIRILISSTTTAAGNIIKEILKQKLEVKNKIEIQYHRF